MKMFVKDLSNIYLTLNRSKYIFFTNILMKLNIVLLNNYVNNIRIFVSY
jgi:hypothetical protein